MRAKVSLFVGAGISAMLLGGALALLALLAVGFCVGWHGWRRELMGDGTSSVRFLRDFRFEGGGLCFCGCGYFGDVGGWDLLALLALLAVGLCVWLMG